LHFIWTLGKISKDIHLQKWQIIVVFFLQDKIPGSTAFIWLSFIVRSLEAVGNSCLLTSSFSIIAKEFPDRVKMT